MHGCPEGRRPRVARARMRRRGAPLGGGAPVCQGRTTMNLDIAEKLRSIKTVIGSIEKQFGKGAIMSLGDEDDTDVPVIPSGSLAIDDALGVGGYPRGRIVEIYGPESSGKTTLTLHALREAQRGGG